MADDDIHGEDGRASVPKKDFSDWLDKAMVEPGENEAQKIVGQGTGYTGIAARIPMQLFFYIPVPFDREEYRDTLVAHLQDKLLRRKFDQQQLLTTLGYARAAGEEAMTRFASTPGNRPSRLLMFTNGEEHFYPDVMLHAETCELTVTDPFEPESEGEKRLHPRKDEKELLKSYRRLHAGLSDMVESGRLKEGDIPDDYAWLSGELSGIAAKDPE